MMRTLIVLLMAGLLQDPPKPPSPPPTPPAPTQEKPVEKPQEKEKKKATEAEEFLKKVEEKATKAKTIKFKSKFTLPLGDQESTFESEGCFKEGNKVKLSVEGEMMGQAMQMSIVSDGKKMRLEATGPRSTEPETLDTAKDLGEGLRLCLLRIGSLVGLFVGDKKAREGDTVFKELVEVDDVAFGKEEKVGDRAAKVLTYTLIISGKTEKGEGKLWVDAETLAPLKHEITGPRGEVVTETFSEWKLDEEIKDEAFALPKEKR